MTSLLRELVPLPMPAVASSTIVSRPRSASSRATARPTAPAPTTTASTRSTAGRRPDLGIELRRVVDRGVLPRIVVDPQLRTLGADDPVELVHRLHRLLLVEVEAGHPALREVFLEVRRVAAEYDHTGHGQADEQRLVTGRVAGRRQDPHRAVAEHVEVAFELDDATGAQALVGRRREPVLRRLGAEGGVVLGLLDIERRRREEVGIADMVPVEMRERQATDLVRRHTDL